jgi:two-component system NtrC family sensor kinase
VYPNPRDDFSDRDYYFEQKKQDRGLYLGQTYIGKISNIPIFNFSIRRSSKDGSFDGVIGSSAFVEYFESFYSTAGPSDDNFSVLLLRSDGHILARHPRVGVGANLPDSIVTKLTAQPAVLTYEKSPFDGRERLYSVIKVGSFPAFIAYSIDTYSISKHWWNEVAIAGLLTGAVSSLMLWLGLLALRHAKIEHEFADQLRRSTAELRAEMDKRKAAETSLMQAQRLDAVGRLAGGIAHDFNNLLMIVKGNLTLAKKRVDSLAVQKHLQSAEHAADRGADLTRHLLSFSRGQTLNPVVIDLKSTFTRARSWIAVAISDSLDFELSLPSDLWNIRADKSELEAALLNLIVNARDALRGNGKIILRASNVRLEELEGLEEGPGEYVNVSVEDNGPGMAADVLSRVYEPFFTKRSGQGLWARLEPSTRFYAAIWWKDCHQIGGREGNSHRPLFPPLQRGGGSFPELRTACFNTHGNFTNCAGSRR